MKFGVIKFAAATVALFAASSAHASVINWATWTSGPTGTMAGGVTATYTGDYVSIVQNYPSWMPSSSYIGGTISNAPPQSGGIVQLVGGNSDINTISFSTAVVNPVMAIWSLGAAGSAAEFDFLDEPFIIEAGGPSNEYGGSVLSRVGTDNVLGVEGNGVIQFQGTFTSISFINPSYEDWYGITVGTVASDKRSAVPEPLTISLFGAGLAGAVALRRRKRAAAA